jgi:uncharacterized membrane protein
MAISCPHCAAQMPDTAAFCPGCGRAMQVTGRAHGTVGVLPEKVAGALAYVTFVPAVVFLFLEPYKKNRFVRFHSFQCVLFWAASLILGVALKFVSLVLFIIPALGPLLVMLVATVLVLAVLVIWLVLVVKALQGEAFKLPGIGDFAEQQAGTV